MGMILAIDPGKCSGFAMFNERGVLYRCGVFEFSEYPRVSMQVMRDDRAIIERPQIYPHDPVPANDLITLAIFVGRLTQVYEDLGHLVEHVLPKEWKGQLPKDVCWRRIAAKLSGDETRVVEQAKLPRTYVHNMHDAIGIGIWKLGR